MRQVSESRLTEEAEINRILHRFPVLTEKFQPEGKRIMPETRFTEFPALTVFPRVGISRSVSENDVR